MNVKNVWYIDLPGVRKALEVNVLTDSHEIDMDTIVMDLN